MARRRCPTAAAASSRESSGSSSRFHATSAKPHAWSPSGDEIPADGGEAPKLAKLKYQAYREAIDELLENRQSRARHGYLPVVTLVLRRRCKPFRSRVRYSRSGSPSTVQRRSRRRSCLGKSVRAWIVQRLSHIRKSPGFHTCS